VLLDTAERTQPRLYALYVQGVTTGMRQSELIGLQWGDLDLGAGRLTVKRSVFKGKVSTPKTARGSRAVRLTRLAVDALIRHKNEHKTSKTCVFGTRNDTTLDCANFHHDHRQRLLDDAGCVESRYSPTISPQHLHPRAVVAQHERRTPPL
jgi:integrase